MKLRCAIAALLLILLASLNICYAEYDLKDKIRRVYLELACAEKEGADVGEAVAKLDDALQLIIQAESVSNPVEKSKLLSRAEALINEVETSIPELIGAGRSAAQLRVVVNVASIISLIVVVALVYFYGPRGLWGLWLRCRGDWRVKRVD